MDSFFRTSINWTDFDGTDLDDERTPAAGDPAAAGGGGDGGPRFDIPIPNWDSWGASASAAASAAAGPAGRANPGVAAGGSTVAARPPPAGRRVTIVHGDEGAAGPGSMPAGGAGPKGSTLPERN